SRGALLLQSLLCPLWLQPLAAHATSVSSVAPVPATAAAPATETTAPPEVAPEKTAAGHTRFDLNRADIVAFVDRVSGKGLPREAVFAVLAKAEPQPRIIEAMNRPAEKTLAWWEYRAHFLTAERIDAGARLWREHRELFDAIAMERHVPPEYVLGIIGVETYFGRIMGRYRVLDALTTLAFDYPARSEYFQRELEQFLLLTRTGELDAQVVLGSYAGAMGAAQFMPSSFRNYAVDESGTGHRDLWTDWADIFASVANYLQQHGWEYGQPVLAEARLGSAPDPATPTGSALNETLGALRARGMQVASLLDDATPCMLLAAPQSDGMAYRVGFRNFYVITRYNHSPLYAMAVNDLAQALSARVLAADAP
ncbi:MAG: lytic murein transglycosylase B, partial [Gammaproteobacteria bacterium]|nr:lytic murein transglycosylase B [Gammaproteobacteria bacterium]